MQFPMQSLLHSSGYGIISWESMESVGRIPGFQSQRFGPWLQDMLGLENANFGARTEICTPGWLCPIPVSVSSLQLPAKAHKTCGGQLIIILSCVQLYVQQFVSASGSCGADLALGLGTARRLLRLVLSFSESESFPPPFNGTIASNMAPTAFSFPSFALVASPPSPSSSPSAVAQVATRVIFVAAMFSVPPVRPIALNEILLASENQNKPA